MNEKLYIFSYVLIGAMSCSGSCTVVGKGYGGWAMWVLALACSMGARGRGQSGGNSREGGEKEATPLCLKSSKSDFTEKDLGLRSQFYWNLLQPLSNIVTKACLLKWSQ